MKKLLVIRQPVGLYRQSKEGEPDVEDVGVEVYNPQLVPCEEEPRVVRLNGLFRLALVLQTQEAEDALYIFLEDLDQELCDTMKRWRQAYERFNEYAAGPEKVNAAITLGELRGEMRIMLRAHLRVFLQRVV
jgi:hypothetical protein